MTSVLLRTTTVRAGITLAGVAIVFAMLLATTSAEAATQRRGLLTIEKKITLTFPAPGAYLGELSFGKRKFAKNAENGAGHKAGKAAQRAAKRLAQGFCNSSMRKTPVQVVHLSDPPFLIGASKPTRLTYKVIGPEPPIGDPVRASQSGAVRKFSVRGFKWEARCRPASVLKLYG